MYTYTTHQIRRSARTTLHEPTYVRARRSRCARATGGGRPPSMDVRYTLAYVRRRSRSSRRPRPSPASRRRTEAAVVPTACVRGDGTARRGFFVASRLLRSTVVREYSGRGPLPLPRPSRPSHIRSSCVPGVCRVWLRDGMVVPCRAENGTGISRSYDTVSAKLI